MSSDNARLADVLAAMSVITDLGTGHGPGKAVRACVVATGLAHAMDLPERDVRSVYYTTMLRHLGCTATSHEESHYFGGDEFVSRLDGERADFGDAREMVGLMLATGRGQGWARPRYLVRAMRLGKDADTIILGSLCEVAALLARRLELDDDVITGVYQVFERWDGSGAPEGLAGEEISVAARLAELAHHAVLFDELDGADGAIARIKSRAGGWFDPEACAAFTAVGPELLSDAAVGDAWEKALDVEPEPVATVPEWRLTDVARAFADMVDLKTIYTLGHSAETARLATEGARGLGLPDDEVTAIERAGLLHDLGRMSVSNAVWEKPGSLDSVEWEQVRLHPYYTERILSRSEALRPLARLAGMHHERQDGGGYHHQASAAEISTAARLLAAADAFQAMTQERPHREALSTDQAAAALVDEARAGHLDSECVNAVLLAAGEHTRADTTWPDGLTDREVDVLRLVATGTSNKQIGEQLFVSPRTAEHHVQNIYAKLGVSTRAAVAIYAMEHDLLRR